MRGRKPTPTPLKILSGNPGKRPLNTAEPRPRSTAPSCPKHLDKEARREWNRISKELHRLGLLTVIDRATLAAYCQAWSRWLKLEAIVQRTGETILDPATKRFSTNPYYTAMNASLKLMLSVASEFGLTPASRTRLAVTPISPERDELDRFLDRG
jgi:P27 family predicted phage terminase small subunit